MGSSESTGRSNGGEKEDERPTDATTPNVGAAAIAIGTAAVAAWGVSRMLSGDDKVKDEMHGAFRSLGMQPNSGGSTSSAPPRRFKLNTDGACHPVQDGKGPSGYAGILKDGDGKFVRGFRGFIGESDCLTVELHGILKGLELLDKLGCKESILESDCQAAVEWVTEQNDGRTGKSRIVRDCWESIIMKSRQLVRKNNITVRHCSRDANKDADKLATIAINKREAYVEFTDVSFK